MNRVSRYSSKLTRVDNVRIPEVIKSHWNWAVDRVILEPFRHKLWKLVRVFPIEGLGIFNDFPFEQQDEVAYDKQDGLTGQIFLPIFNQPFDSNSLIICMFPNDILDEIEKLFFKAIIKLESPSLFESTPLIALGFQFILQFVDLLRDIICSLLTIICQGLLQFILLLSDFLSLLLKELIRKLDRAPHKLRNFACRVCLLQFLGISFTLRGVPANVGDWTVDVPETTNALRLDELTSSFLYCFLNELIKVCLLCTLLCIPSSPLRSRCRRGRIEFFLIHILLGPGSPWTSIWHKSLTNQT